MKMLWEEYKDKLEKMYDEFYQTHCKNKNFAECSKGMDPPKFQFDRATRLGRYYGSKGTYKVLVVGKEGTNEETHTEITEPSTSIELASNLHYRCTLYTLALVEGKEPNSVAKRDLEEYDDLLRQFCLTNYFKCAFSACKQRIHGLSINRAMKDNCYELLLREIGILEPELIIIQGKFTSKPFWNALEEGGWERIYGNKTPKDDTISLYRYTLDQHTFYVIWSYHPSYCKGWNSTKDALKMAIQEFRKALPR